MPCVPGAAGPGAVHAAMWAPAVLPVQHGVGGACACRAATGKLCVVWGESTMWGKMWGGGGRRFMQAPVGLVVVVS